MNKTITLIAVEDEYDSEPGLAPKGMDTKFEGFMASRSGMLVAHDVLEHVNGFEAIGGIPDELEALGALWQVRGRHGDMLNPNKIVGSAYTVAENVAFDVSRMAEDMSGNPGDYWPGSTHIEPEDEHLYDDEFRVILAYARAHIVDGHAALGDVSSDFPVDAYLADALHLVRRGFRKAEELYGEAFGGTDLFVAVRDAVDRIKRDVQVEGQEFILEIQDGEARCWEVDMEMEAWDA